VGGKTIEDKAIVDSTIDTREISNDREEERMPQKCDTTITKREYVSGYERMKLGFHGWRMSTSSE
jgi:hypothetical protein